MSETCHEHVDIRPKCHGFSMKLCPIATLIWKEDPEKKSCMFYFLLHFWALHDERSTLHGQNRKMHTSIYASFPLKFGTFQAFSNMLTTCWNVAVISVIFSKTRHLRVPTKKSTIVLQTWWWKTAFNFYVFSTYIWTINVAIFVTILNESHTSLSYFSNCLFSKPIHKLYRDPISFMDIPSWSQIWLQVRCDIWQR